MKNPKRYLSAILASLILLSATACTLVSNESADETNEKNDVTASSTVSETESTAEPETVPVTEPGTELVTEPGTESVTVPVTEPVTEPTDEPSDEPSDEPFDEPSDEPESETETETESETETEPVTEPETEVTDDLPRLDFGGAEITVISRDIVGLTHGEIVFDEALATPLNEAVFERNKAVEEKLNVKIVHIPNDTFDPYVLPNLVATDVKGGSTEYDIMAASAYTTIQHTLSGNFVNLADNEYINLSKPYWLQALNETISYKNLQFMATGSFMPSVYRLAFATMFNKDLFEEANQPLLYEYVENGSWTVDQQASLTSLFYRDNGDGMPDSQDVFGFVTGTSINVDPYWSAFRVDVMPRNQEGAWETAGTLTDSLVATTDKLLNLYYGETSSTYAVETGTDDSEQAEIRNMFASGHAAMATLRLVELENDDFQDFNYGIVPMPKFDEAQDGYTSHLHDQFTIVAVPYTIANERLDMVSAVLESMASAGHALIRPAYCETVLRAEFDPEAKDVQMLDTIADGIHIDFGILHNDFNFHAALRQMMYDRRNTTASMLKARLKAASYKLRTIVANLDKMSEINTQ